jgi:hypothetical protein
MKTTTSSIYTIAVMAALVVAMNTTAEAGEFLIDLADGNGSAAGWDVFTTDVTDSAVTDQLVGDNDVTLTITGIAGEGTASPPGTGATIDAVSVPKEARDDYVYGVNPSPILFEFKNLNAGTYNVSVFEGRTTDGGQYGKIWAGAIGDEPGAENTGNFAGGSSTRFVTIGPGDSLFYRHLEDNTGGTSGIIIRKVTPAAAPEFRIDLADLGGWASPWDVFTNEVTDSSLIDWSGGDNDVTLTITSSGSGLIENNTGAPGTSAVIDTVTAPKEARDDYVYDNGSGDILFEFKNLDAGTYNVSVFEGRTTDGDGQYGKIWAGAVGDEPGSENTGDYAGTNSTVEVTVHAGKSLFLKQLWSGSGGLSGIIVRQTSITTPPAGTIFIFE